MQKSECSGGVQLRNRATGIEFYFFKRERPGLLMTRSVFHVDTGSVSVASPSFVLMSCYFF